MSIGVSSAIDSRARWEPAVRAADRALYDAKRRGRNRVAVASDEVEGEGLVRAVSAGAG